MTDGHLRYNVRWIEHTFTSRAVTEALLSPERESGNITTKDYEAATNFFPGPTRRYRVGLLMSLPFQSAKHLALDGWWYRRPPRYVCCAQALVAQYSHLSVHDHRLCLWYSRWPYDVHFRTLELCSFN